MGPSISNSQAGDPLEPSVIQAQSVIFIWSAESVIFQIFYIKCALLHCGPDLRVDLGPESDLTGLLPQKVVMYLSSRLIYSFLTYPYSS